MAGQIISFNNQVSSIDDGLVMDLSLNDNSGPLGIVYEHSGANNNGTLVADTHFVSTPKGQALSFDGTGDYVNFGDILGFDLSDQFTFNIVHKRAALATTMHIVSKMQSSGDFTGYRIRYVSDNTIQFILIDNLSALISVVSAAITSLDAITLTATYDGSGSASGMKLYINGAEISTTPTDSGSPTSVTNGVNFNIGARNNSIEFFNGQIHYVRAYDRVLIASEVQELYLRGTQEKPEYKLYQYIAATGVLSPTYYHNHLLAG